MMLCQDEHNKVDRQLEQCKARLDYLEKHQHGIGREAALLRRRIGMLQAFLSLAVKP